MSKPNRVGAMLQGMRYAPIRLAMIAASLMVVLNAASLSAKNIPKNLVGREDVAALHIVIPRGFRILKAIKYTLPDGSKRLLIVTGAKGDPGVAAREGNTDYALNGAIKVYNFALGRNGDTVVSQKWQIVESSEGAASVEDLLYADVVDGDGNGEPLAMVMYSISGTDASAPTKLIAYYKDRKYAIRGLEKCPECVDGPFKSSVTADANVALLPQIARQRMWQVWGAHFDPR